MLTSKPGSMLRMAFYDAVRAQDQTRVYAMLNDFVIPYAQLRDRQQG